MTDSDRLAKREPEPTVALPIEDAQPLGPLIRAESHELHIGPLPDPTTLRAYDEICEGAADRIITMAEKQADHRRHLEKTVIASDCRAQDRGPVFGFILASLVIIAGVALLATGRNIEGLIALLAPLASIVIPFLYSKRKQQKELKGSKFKDQPAPTPKQPHTAPEIPSSGKP